LRAFRRAAAESAARAGFAVTAIDAFADADRHPGVDARALRAVFRPMPPCSSHKRSRATRWCMGRTSRIIRAPSIGWPRGVGSGAMRAK
jgi:hypothetical protein